MHDASRYDGQYKYFYEVGVRSAVRSHEFEILAGIAISGVTQVHQCLWLGDEGRAILVGTDITGERRGPAIVGGLFSCQDS